MSNIRSANLKYYVLSALERYVAGWCGGFQNNVRCYIELNRLFTELYIKQAE